MRVRFTAQTMFRNAPRARLASSLLAALAAAGVSGCVIHATDTGGSGGSTSTSSTSSTSASTGGSGGAGGGTIPFGGSGGATDTTTITTVHFDCGPAPDLKPQINPLVPEGIPADVAMSGYWARADVAPDGDAAVATHDGAHVYVRRYHGGQWSDLEQVASSSAEFEIAMPTLAMATGGQGRVIVVYAEWQSPYVNLCARTFDPATGWSAPESLGVSDSGWWQDPAGPEAQAAMGPSGDSMVMWPRNSDNAGGLFVRRLSGGAVSGGVDEVAGWASVLATPVLRLRDDGTAVVAWEDIHATSARVHDPASGWGAVQQLGSYGRGLRLVPGSGGSTVAVWAELDGGEATPIKTAVLAADTFGPAQTIDPTGGINLAAATAADGTGIVGWESYTPDCVFNSHVLLRDAGGVFSDPGPIPGLDDGPVRGLGTAAAPGGKVALGWSVLDPAACGATGAMLSWFDPDSGVWQQANLDPDGTAPWLEMGPGGRALAVWTHKSDPATPTALVRWVDLPTP